MNSSSTKLSDLIVTVSTGVDTSDFLNDVHLYSVRVKSLDGQIDKTTLHQYSDFYALDSHIRREYHHEHAHLFENIPALPSKISQFVSETHNETMIQDRANKLQLYLRSTMKLPFIDSVNDVWKFFDLVSPMEEAHRRNSSMNGADVKQQQNDDEVKNDGPKEKFVLPLMVTMPRTQIVENFIRDVVLYEVRVIDANGIVFTEMHEFDHFHDLNSVLTAKLPADIVSSLPELPSKYALFTDHKAPAFIDGRKNACERFLTAVLQIDNVLDIPEVYKFVFN